MASVVPDVCMQYMYSTGLEGNSLHKYSVIADTSTKEAIDYTVNCAN